ncbi:unnamed protein product [Meganyctiphanes norvegica]|uniref:Cystatin domain-containing protein n=1 Tax=Meganyctiphanes norvegica TaxID=48144 RepID=A0AAV2PYH1_MEGNR
MGGCGRHMCRWFLWLLCTTVVAGVAAHDEGQQEFSFEEDIFIEQPQYKGAMDLETRQEKRNPLEADSIGVEGSILGGAFDIKDLTNYLETNPITEKNKAISQLRYKRRARQKIKAANMKRDKNTKENSDVDEKKKPVVKNKLDKKDRKNNKSLNISPKNKHKNAKSRMSERSLKALTNKINREIMRQMSGSTKDVGKKDKIYKKRKSEKNKNNPKNIKTNKIAKDNKNLQRSDKKFKESKKDKNHDIKRINARKEQKVKKRNTRYYSKRRTNKNRNSYIDKKLKDIIREVLEKKVNKAKHRPNKNTARGRKSKNQNPSALYRKPKLYTAVHSSKGGLKPTNNTSLKNRKRFLWSTKPEVTVSDDEDDMEGSGSFPSSISSTSSTTTSSPIPTPKPSSGPDPPADCNKEDQIYCGDGKTVICGVQWCDDTEDCPDADDEAQCGCEPSEHECDSDRCIPKHYMCDGRRDCMDNTDETNCSADNGLPSGKECAVGEISCANPRECIPYTQWCDGTADCSDGADERHCGGCSYNEFFCGSGECVSNVLRCDGFSDCVDGADENNCPCDGDVFHCNGGGCVPSRRRCDGRVDCKDASDESNCDQGSIVPGGPSPPKKPTIAVQKLIDAVKPEVEKRLGCRLEDFKLVMYRTQVVAGINYFAKVHVGGGQYVHLRVFKDLQGNGGLHSMEYPKLENDDLYYIEKDYITTTACPGEVVPPVKCSFGELLCGDQLSCITQKELCDGIANCRDHSDELDCGCREDEFLCKNGLSCIGKTLLCDGVTDCPDGSDEDCGCAPGEFLCDGRFCLPESRRCDGYFDCQDSTDEMNCGHKPNCGSGGWKCTDGTCIQSRQRCDGVYQCPDQSDEYGCKPVVPVVPPDNPRPVPTVVRCALSWRYIRRDQVCDGVQDCLMGTDECACYWYHG